MVMASPVVITISEVGSITAMEPLTKEAITSTRTIDRSTTPIEPCKFKLLFYLSLFPLNSTIL